jgi:altronate dehydratase
MSNLIHLNEKDNVAMASVSLEKGTKIKTHDLVCNTVIPAGHKVAIYDIPKEDPIYKYGDIIGYALEHIKKDKR